MSEMHNLFDVEVVRHSSLLLHYFRRNEKHSFANVVKERTLLFIYFEWFSSPNEQCVVTIAYYCSPKNSAASLLGTMALVRAFVFPYKVLYYKKCLLPSDIKSSKS